MCYRIFVIEDDPIIARTVCEYLTRRGDPAPSGGQAGGYFLLGKYPT